MEEGLARRQEELARTTTATPSASHSTGSPADSISSSEHEAPQPQVDATTMGSRPPPCMKKEEVIEATVAAVARPTTLSLPQLEVAKQPPQQLAEWMQDPFVTQLRSPWMESW